YVDAANDRVGIGTISPQAKLDVEGSIKADNFQTDVISRIVPIYIRGTGLNNNANRVLKIGNMTIYDTNGRGLRFTVINKADYSIIYDATFDTYGYASESDNLANNITTRMNKNTIGILTSYDAWEERLTNSLRDAFKRCGLTKALMTPTSPIRQPYAAIFECNTTIGSAKAVEVLVTNDVNERFAEIRGWLIDGSFVVTGDVPNALANNIGTTPVVMVNEAGNVGIGTTSPSSKLEVYGGDIEINDGAATGSYKIKGLKMFYAGDETNVSTTSTTYVLIKKLTAVLNETYGIKPSYINVLARLGGSATTYMNISLPGCAPSTQISGSGAGVLAKASIAVSGCTAEIQPIEVYLKTTSGTGWNDIIEFYYVM
ncbi:MAG: interleukin-like EMT inducer domain-containing protein, partial [Candidatus Aenigmatarchaeota archaeon]